MRGVHPSKPWCWRGKQLHHGGDVVCLCLASKKPSEQEFFVPVRTDLAVKLLRIFKFTLALGILDWYSSVREVKGQFDQKTSPDSKVTIFYLVFILIPKLNIYSVNSLNYRPA